MTSNSFLLFVPPENLIQHPEPLILADFINKIEDEEPTQEI